MKQTPIDDPGRLMEMVNAFRLSRIVLTSNELGIFDALRKEPMTSVALAGQIGTAPRATDRLMNALVALGLLFKEADMFSNTPFSTRFLVRSSPAYLGGLSLSNATWKTWSTLTESVRKGSTVVMESHINERPAEWQEAFIAAMHTRGAVQATEVAELLDLGNTQSFLDVGGGSGAFSFAMIRKNPVIRATIFDLPAILPITEKYIRESGFAGQVNTLAGNYLAEDLGSGYDLVFMSAIIHINSPEENELLIRKGADALRPGGQLVILDHIMSEDRTSPAVGAYFALNMLVGTIHGDTYTEGEVRAWMRNAGLSSVTLEVTPSGQQLMISRKK